MRPHLPRFLIEPVAQPGETLPLRAEEAKHARVRRLRVGDAVALFDGAGHSYLGRLESLSRDAAAVHVVEALPERDGESALALTLAVAALKADRLDWVVEKATELGVAAIQPFRSTHTLGQPSRDRQGRWHQIALSAAKQCGRSVAPAIGAPLDFGAVLALPAAARVLFAEDGSGASLASLALPAPSSLLAIVGGEGGFGRRLEAPPAGCHLVSLGLAILRARPPRSSPRRSATWGARRPNAVEYLPLGEGRWGPCQRATPSLPAHPAPLIPPMRFAFVMDRSAHPPQGHDLGSCSSRASAGRCTTSASTTCLIAPAAARVTGRR